MAQQELPRAGEWHGLPLESSYLRPTKVLQLIQVGAPQPECLAKPLDEATSFGDDLTKVKIRQT